MCRSLPSLVFLAALSVARLSAAEFIETFERNDPVHDPGARNGWTWVSGDGEAEITFSKQDGMGVIEVDAREDRRNIWWAFIRHAVSGHIDRAELPRADRELRVEVKLRSSVAPRRVNLHFNHSRTTDYHSHLKEFDIPEAKSWHVISMTTHGFDARPEDDVFVQMALMDWGRDQYRVDIDYVKVSIVDPAVAEPDLGEPLPYRPDLPATETFSQSAFAVQDGVVDTARPQMNFDGRANRSEAGELPLVTAGGSKITVMRWDSAQFAGHAPRGWGILELTTEQVYGAERGVEGADQLRVVEILGGRADWIRETLTLDGLSAGHAAGEVFNDQMMIDISPNPVRGGKTRIAVSPPVLRRLFSGRTRGLAIRAQGAVQATFISGHAETGEGPVLYFNSH